MSDTATQYQDFLSRHSYERSEVDGVEWLYLSCGKGKKALLLLTGLLGRGDSWFPLIDELQMDYRILAPSYFKIPSLAQFQDTLPQILDAEGIERVHVVGQSFGGLVAQCVVRRHGTHVESMVLSHTGAPDPSKLGAAQTTVRLLSALPVSVNRWLLRQRIKPWVRARVPDSAFWRRYREDLIRSSTKEDFLHAYRFFVGMLRDYSFTRHDLSEWPGRVLIIESDDDPAIPEAGRNKLKALYPEANVHTFHGAGHSSLLAKKNEFVALLRSFLES